MTDEVDDTPRPPQGPTHIILAILGDEGSLYWWGVESCPGTEGGCITLTESVDGCRCTDPDCPCRAGEHWSCDDWDSDNLSDIGPGCSIEPTKSCGIADYIDGVGGEMIMASDLTIRFAARHEWQDPTYPVLRIEQVLP